MNRQRPFSAWWLRAMLCGIGIYYGISLLAAEELARRGWREQNFPDAMRLLILAARFEPFDHRFREYPMMRFIKENAK